MIPQPERRPYRYDVILAGNERQARDYVQQHRLNPKTTIIVGTPHALRGVRGPILVHRIGTFESNRSRAFQEEVWRNISIIQATADSTPVYPSVTPAMLLEDTDPLAEPPKGPGRAGTVQGRHVPPRPPLDSGPEVKP